MPDKSSKPVWLITGCSTGFGRELAKILIGAATGSWRPRAIRRRSPTSSRATPERPSPSRSTSKRRLTSTPPWRRRSGDSAASTSSSTTPATAISPRSRRARIPTIRAMFETNFFGLAAMTRAVLPVMRAQKSGAIVNISSMGGFIGFPGSGYYAATKFAVEGLSELLSKEVAPFGIKVLIVEPGPFRTDWGGRSLKVPKRPIDAYAETAIARRHQIQSYSGAQPGDPVRAAEAIIATVEARNPPLRLPLGNFAYDAMRAEIEVLRKEVETVEEAARGADFPQGA